MTSVRVWAWLAVALATVVGVCLVVAVQAAGPDTPRAAGVPGPAAPSSPGTSARAGGPVAPPVGLRIPVIAVDAPVIRLGLNEDRTVEVPGNAVDTGWYRLGPPPGARGSAVILGHVDSEQGPGVFHRLRYLEPGDRVHVDAADGTTSTFRVVRLATYPNQDFPAQQVYQAPGRRRVLNLVTCGGAYDPETGYEANVVVYTRWVSGS